MSKTLKRVLILAFACGILATQFQNCAPANSGLEVNLSSLGDEDLPDEPVDVIDQTHSDQNHGTEVPVVEKPALEQSRALLDRKAVYNLFVDVFGPGVESFGVMTTLKAEKAIMGSPCSLYDNFRSARANFGIDRAADPCANTDAANSMSAPLNPVGNVIQQAMINNVCQAAVATTSTFNYFLAQVRGSTGTSTPANTEENIRRMFHLFYRGKPAPHEALVQSLQIIVGHPATINGWKTAISTTCVSSHWQAL